ncbi:MAG: hypothetical protein CM15mP93_13430 [Thiotrichaceae bacterium]|jgi:uncharacterized integral membrane protein|nr:MAG: hypothetical protein CM15mP93_13430 [Thiotrichaceae bacterium]
MYKIIFFIISMLLSISLVGIVVLNNAHILLNIYFQQVEVTIGMAIVLSVIVGSIVSFIFIGSLILFYRGKYVKLKKENEVVKKEVQNLRKIPMQE